MNKSDFYYEENERRLKQAILKDFKELLVKEFTTNWQAERFMIEMYLSVMSLDNTMKLLGNEKMSYKTSKENIDVIDEENDEEEYNDDDADCWCE